MTFKLQAKLAVAACTALLAVPHAHAAAPKNPVVLVHGFTGFDTVLGLDYWYGITKALEKDGVKVLVAQVNPSQTSEYRGEELVKQLQAWKVANKVTKFNLIGHSQGGPTVRYAASVRPDLVASATTVGGVNLGSTLADKMVNDKTIAEGNWLDSFGTSLLKLMGLASSYDGDADKIDASIAAQDMTYASAVAFNKKYPEGAPAIEGKPGTQENGSNGVKYFSIAGDANGTTNSFDVIDLLLVSTTAKTVFKDVVADGVVQTSSQYWGKHLKTYPWNHFDEVNQSLGLIGKSAPSPKDVYRSLAQMLASKGL